MGYATCVRYAMTCVVCFDANSNVFICAICGNGMCHECTSRLQGRTDQVHRHDCGVCRQPFLPRDGGNGDKHTMVVDLIGHEHAGVTLANAAHGVRIVDYDQRDAVAASGMRRRGTILAINGVPVGTHAHAINLIQVATAQRVSLRCEYASPDRCRPGHKLRWDPRGVWRTPRSTGPGAHGLARIES